MGLGLPEALFDTHPRCAYTRTVAARKVPRVRYELKLQTTGEIE